MINAKSATRPMTGNSKTTQPLKRAAGRCKAARTPSEPLLEVPTETDWE